MSDTVNLKRMIEGPRRTACLRIVSGVLSISNACNRLIGGEFSRITVQTL